MSSLHIIETSPDIKGDGVRMKIGCPFMYLAKYQGDRGPRPEPTGDVYLDQLLALQADLADPACFEIIVGGDAFPTQVWRK